MLPESVRNLGLVDLALLCHPIIALLGTFSKTQSKASRREWLAISFFTLLSLRFYAASSATTLVLTPVDDALCQTHDAPNPIAHIYPGNATGTLNGTITVLPIPLSLAQQLVPYKILTSAYQHILPSFPTDMYPAILQALHDHEVQAFGYRIPDFTRTGIEFPFLDMFNDGTNFKWAPSLLMTAGHEFALKGARDYGTNVFDATFDPVCDAYRAAPGSAPRTTMFEAKSESKNAASLSTIFSLSQGWTYPLEFFKNVTNQPTFADGKTCDNMIRLFNTSVTTSIETVRGRVEAKIPPFDKEQVWEGAEGIRLDSAFIENNYLPCESFKGYGSS